MNLSLDNDPLFGVFLSFSTYGAIVSWKITKNFSIIPAGSCTSSAWIIPSPEHQKKYRPFTTL